MPKNDTTEQKREFYENWLMNQIHKMYKDAYEMRYDKKGFGLGEFQDDIVELLTRLPENQPAPFVQTKPIEPIQIKPIEPEIITPAKEDIKLGINLKDYYKSLNPIQKLQCKMTKMTENKEPNQNLSIKDPIAVNPIDEQRKSFLVELADPKTVPLTMLIGEIALGAGAFAMGNIALVGAVVVMAIMVMPGQAKILSDGRMFSDNTELIEHQEAIDNQLSIAEKPINIQISKPEEEIVQPATISLSGKEVLKYGQAKGLTAEQVLEFQSTGSITLDLGNMNQTTISQESIKTSGEQINQGITGKIKNTFGIMDTKTS